MPNVLSWQACSPSAVQERINTQTKFNSAQKGTTVISYIIGFYLKSAITQSKAKSFNYRNGRIIWGGYYLRRAFENVGILYIISLWYPKVLLYNWFEDPDWINQSVESNVQKVQTLIKGTVT